MLKHTIRPLPIVRVRMSQRGFFTYLVVGGRAFQTMGSIYFIEGPKERILVDSSFPEEMLSPSYSAKFLPQGTSTVFLESECVMSFEEALKKVRLTPKDIDILILTHMENDHAGQAHKCVNARIIVQKDEWDFANAPHPLHAWRYPPRDLLEKIRSLNLEIIEGDKEIVPGVKVLLTPGHTPGCQSVLVDTVKGPAAIAGFCSCRENFEPPISMDAIYLVPPGVRFPILPPNLNTNSMQAYDSILRLKEIAEIILPMHDIHPEVVPPPSA